MIDPRQYHKHTAVLWANPVPDGMGRYTFDAPVEIRCRWRVKRAGYMGEGGKIVISWATVRSCTALHVGDLILRGTMAENIDSSSTIGSPYDLSAFTIKSVEELADLYGVTIEWKALL